MVSFRAIILRDVHYFVPKTTQVFIARKELHVKWINYEFQILKQKFDSFQDYLNKYLKTLSFPELESPYNQLPAKLLH